MPDRPYYPRKARIIVVKKGNSKDGGGIISYELRTDYPHVDSLISEHKTQDEAQDAKQRYERM
ncbi:YaiA family protein [Pantoea sp. Mhis]|uniref:YaiA family protein n=1 Tax=Pantoea sp. Mhis TaxID=2576759 RepID=UPI001359B3FB|nr:YaiA family protein [Pantoea sp. Mhis]MXP56226.1 hypothetical protein [Pantoea sp. Mhis]